MRISPPSTRRKLGKRLLRVAQLMHTGAELPARHHRVRHARGRQRNVPQEAGDDLRGRPDGRLAGIITDGDLRRHITEPGVLERRAVDVMTADPATIAQPNSPSTR